MLAWAIIERLRVSVSIILIPKSAHKKIPFEVCVCIGKGGQIYFLRLMAGWGRRVCEGGVEGCPRICIHERECCPSMYIH